MEALTPFNSAQGFNRFIVKVKHMTKCNLSAAKDNSTVPRR